MPGRYASNHIQISRFTKPLILLVVLGVVPEAGLEQVRALSALSKAHPQCLRHQRHAASKLSNIRMVRHFRRFVKTC
jgi:hypothetical protein